MTSVRVRMITGLAAAAAGLPALALSHSGGSPTSPAEHRPVAMLLAPSYEDHPVAPGGTVSWDLTVANVDRVSLDLSLTRPRWTSVGPASIAGDAMELTPGSRLTYTVTVAVPDGTPPGRYPVILTATLAQAEAGGRESATSLVLTDSEYVRVTG